MNYKCNRCGSIDFYTEPRGCNIGLFCSMCDKWEKWLGKDEAFLFEHNKATNKKNKNIKEKEIKITRDNYVDLIKIAEMFSKWLTKTSKELNMNEDDLQEIIKQFLS